MNGDNNENAAMPKALTEKLRAAASRTSVLVPEAVDETVLSRSRLYFAQIRQRRSKARQPWWLAAAACVALQPSWDFHYLRGLATNGPISTIADVWIFSMLLLWPGASSRARPGIWISMATASSISEM